MSDFIVIEAIDLKLLLGEVPQLARHLLLYKTKAYNEVIELKQDACPLIFNLSLMNFDLFFKGSIVVEKHFEFLFEYFFLPIDPGGVGEVASSVVDNAGDFGVVEIAFAWNLLYHLLIL